MKNMLEKFTVFRKLLLLGVFFVLTITGTFLYSVTTLKQLESDASIINVAGRERMLTQKFSKEVMDEIYRRHAAPLSDPGNPELEITQEKTTRLFELSLKALREGGRTYSDLEMTREIMLPPNEDPEVERKLAGVTEAWNQLRQAVDAARKEAMDSPRFPDQVNLIRSLSLDVLSKMHTTVNRMSENSENKVHAMQSAEGFILLFTILLGAYFCVRVGREIISPLQEATVVVSKYAQGHLGRRIHIRSQDEIGQLATAFNIMADHINEFRLEIESKNKELEASDIQLRQRLATLAAANEEIKSFAYIVSHDLRSPLVNLKGFTSELGFTLKEISEKIAQIEGRLDNADREEIKRLIEDDVPESMSFINTSVTKMDAMLNAILKLSRLGRYRLQFEAIDLHELCNSVLETYASHIRDTGIEITCGELPDIFNDRPIMEQIMGNLIGNAIKYLSPDRRGQIRIWSENNSQGITISVEDNGRGIADDEKEKVFQIFRRGRHQDVVGEGMGLAYVQTLARAQNGSISYTSKEDEGSTFSVYLPNRSSEET